jgi:hypothetical protein
MDQDGGSRQCMDWPGPETEVGAPERWPGRKKTKEAKVTVTVNKISQYD